MFVIQEKLRNQPKCRVELHVHLDGAIRYETIWELMRKKKLPLPGKGSLEDLKDSLTVSEPKDLNHFLASFKIFLPAIIDDIDAIERVSYEFVEDLAKQNIAYCEARLCPHLLVSNNCEGKDKEDTASKDGSLTPEDALNACLKGLNRGETEFGTKVRLILCCIRGKQEWSWDILRLCEKYRDKGVVGIDIAGDASSQNESTNLDEIGVFESALEKGIHRTIHAGEDGDAQQVEKALNILHAERIGHGYRVVEDEAIYRNCLENKIHFEMCPHSSYLTGTIKQLQLESKRHPILRLAEDGGSFSINTDDPTVTGTCISDEYKLLSDWGFTEAHFAKANFEAASRSFLPPNEKEELLASLHRAYGIPPVPNRPTTPLPDNSRSPTPGGGKPEVKITSWEDRS